MLSSFTFVSADVSFCFLVPVLLTANLCVYNAHV